MTTLPIVEHDTHGYIVTLPDGQQRHWRDDIDDDSWADWLTATEQTAAALRAVVAHRAEHAGPISLRLVAETGMPTLEVTPPPKRRRHRRLALPVESYGQTCIECGRSKRLHSDTSECPGAFLQGTT